MEERRDRSTEAEELSEEERVRGLMDLVRELVAHGRIEDALAPFSEMHPVDQADVLLDLAAEPGRMLVMALPPAATGEVLEQLEPEVAAQMLRGVETPDLALVLDECSPDVAADILKVLPGEQSRGVLGAMRAPQEVAALLEYPDETAGGLMTPEYPVLRDDVTAANALDVLRLFGSEAEKFSTLYVIDAQGRLVGSLWALRLALVRPNTLVRDIMETEVLSVPSGTDQEEVAHTIERYNLNQIPVLDQDHRIVGVVLVEDVVDVVEEEATEDMYRMAGMRGERLFGPLHSSVGRRLPWLLVNLATTVLAAMVIGLFESTIARVTTLAIFLPVVAGQGGIGGTQTLTLVVRSMALGELSGPRGARLLGREVTLGLVHGLVLGVVIGVVAYLWKGSPVLGLVLGAAMMGNMLVAGLAGAGVPLALRRLGMDPAVASAVFVTTLTDVLGFLMFLGLATALIRFLL